MAPKKSAKKPAKKTAPKKPAKTAGSAKKPARSANAVARKSTARSQALPGMEQARNVRLDNICEGISQERAVMNAASVEEKSLISTALQVMQEKGITVHKHAGVELVRVPGADKLRVRLTKETGSAGVEGGVTTGSSDDEGDGGTRPEPEFDDERDE